MSPRSTLAPLALRSALGVLIVALAASCGSSGESRVSSSGSPEADRRAELRVNSDEGKDGKEKKNEGTLFERLGGNPGVTALVDDFTTRSIADPRVNFDRRNVRTSWIGGTYKPWNQSDENIAVLKQHMVEFITLAAGGPAQYTGRDMGIVHKGMKISNSEFDAMVGDIKTSMDRLNIASREKRELLAVVETTRKEIVEKP